MENINAWEIVVTALLSGAVGIVFWYLKKAIDKIDKKNEEREVQRREYELLSLKMLIGCMDFDKAVAVSIERGKCNGEMRAARENELELRKEIEEFMMKRTVESIGNN